MVPPSVFIEAFNAMLEKTVNEVTKQSYLNIDWPPNEFVKKDNYSMYQQRIYTH